MTVDEKDFKVQCTHPLKGINLILVYRDGINAWK